MAYNKTNWVDHVVENPRTYTYVDNSDGTRTFTPAPGEIIVQGTPKSATNFNKEETGLLDASAALDWAINLISSLEIEVETMKEELAALAATEG